MKKLCSLDAPPAVLTESDDWSKINTARSSNRVSLAAAISSKYHEAGDSLSDAFQNFLVQYVNADRAVEDVIKRQSDQAGGKSVDIKDINCFLTIAQEGSYTRAAEKLYISQPALSRKMANLEAELGLPLIRRVGRRIELTEQGEIFQREAKRLQQDYRDLMLEMDALKQGKGKSISIGYGMAGHIAYMARAIQNLKKRNPYLTIQTKRLFNADILSKLQSGQIDAGIINLPEMPDSPELEYMTLLQCGLCAFIHRNHPLYNRSSIQLKELSGERYITFQRETSPREYDRIVSLCREAGLSEKPVAHAPDTSAFGLMLYTENAAGIMPYTTSTYNDLTVRRIPIHDTEGFDMILVWRKDNDNPVLKQIRAAFRESLAIHN